MDGNPCLPCHWGFYWIHCQLLRGLRDLLHCDCSQLMAQFAVAAANRSALGSDEVKPFEKK